MGRKHCSAVFPLFYNYIFQGRTVDLKTLTLIEDPAEGEGGEDDLGKAEAEFEKLLKESGE